MNDYSKIYNNQNRSVEKQTTEVINQPKQEAPANPVPNTKKEDLGVINSREVYIRKGPGKEYDPVGTVKKDDQVIILEHKDNFLKIETEDGTQAYIMKTFVTID